MFSIDRDTYGCLIKLTIIRYLSVASSSIHRICCCIFFTRFLPPLPRASLRLLPLQGASKIDEYRGLPPRSYATTVAPRQVMIIGKNQLVVVRHFQHQHDTGQRGPHRGGEQRPHTGDGEGARFDAVLRNRCAPASPKAVPNSAQRQHRRKDATRRAPEPKHSSVVKMRVMKININMPTL